MQTNYCILCKEEAIDENNPIFKFSCCGATSCQKCQAMWRDINITCPFCRSTYSFTKTLTVQNNNRNDLDILQNYDKWLSDHNITNNYSINYCRQKIVQIKNVIETNQRLQKPYTYLQVAWSGDPIHVFKLNSDINSLQFKYWDRYGIVEVRDGTYYKRGRETESHIFGWWLHGYIREVDGPPPV